MPSSTPQAAHAATDPHSDGYFLHERRALVGLLDEEVPARVLEVGCASGATLALLAERGTRETYGVELDPRAAEIARTRASTVWEGDAETFEPPLEPGTLDALVVADVLEHLRDPWDALRRWLVYVRPGGVVLASVPNVRHYSVSLGLLLRGAWRYDDRGILDRTHLRFFTRASAVELLAGAGLRVERVEPALGPRRRLLDRCTLGLVRGLLATQYLLRGRKP